MSHGNQPARSLSAGAMAPQSGLKDSAAAVIASGAAFRVYLAVGAAAIVAYFMLPLE